MIARNGMLAVIVVVLMVGMQGWAQPAPKPAGAPSAAVLLEKGIYTEQTVGDLDGAIKIYQQIIDESSAGRSYVAQAQYRLGMAYLKKKQSKEAMAAFEKVISDYADQKGIVAEASARLTEARGKMSEKEVAGLVEEAVKNISTKAETDPGVAKSLASLEGLDDASVVKQLVTWLKSDEDNSRRAAIYIIWKGPFESVAPAVEELVKLCGHKEGLTRGMAALVLGARKVKSALPTLADVAMKDADGYARRAAVYGLGLSGLAEAKPLVEKALEDKDELVRANAQAAKRMLVAPATKPPTVQKTEPAAFAGDVDPATASITVTFDQSMQDRSWSWTGGGETFPKSTGMPSYDAGKTTCTFPVKLEPAKLYWIGINSPSNRNFKSVDGQPARRYVIVFATRSAEGKPTPIPARMLADAKAINQSVEKAPPVVVQTNPAALADRVPASLERITVTFDQPMQDGSWSWTGGGDTFPKPTGKMSYDADRTTCSMPVKLEPGKVYWIGINSPSFQNFKTVAGIPARRYVIVFSTASADGQPTPIPAEMLARAKAINAASPAAGATTGQKP